MSQKLEEVLNEVAYTGLNSAKNGTLSGALTLSGTDTFSGNNTHSGNNTFSGTNTFSGSNTFSSTVAIRQNVLASSGNTTITAATSGSVRLFDSASTTAYVLPAPVVGLYYDFLWTALETSGQAHSITTDAGTTFVAGYIVMVSDVNVTPSATLGPKGFAGDGTSHIKVTMNGTTTGGGIGTLLRFTCISATVWNVSGVVRSPSGTIATCFST